tara:strand:+ start:326 stop:541 length:216 start_codon:yes stop_codon:yes gene_type:complete
MEYQDELAQCKILAENGTPDEIEDARETVDHYFGLGWITDVQRVELCAVLDGKASACLCWPPCVPRGEEET